MGTKKPIESNKFGELKDLLHQIHRSLRRIDEIMPEVTAMVRVDYSAVPGITGTFDGVYLITDSGEKIEVPSNYAAKSRLVCGDVLKKIEEGGKTLFKQIEKVARKKLPAVINKKGGKWFALAETGSYRIVDSVADFNQLQINDAVEIVIPETNPNAPYAALEKSPERLKPVVAAESPVVVSSPSLPVEKTIVAPKPVVAKPVAAPVAESPARVRRAPVSAARPTFRAPRPENTDGPVIRPPRKDYSTAPKEFVDQIGGSSTSSTPSPSRVAELLDDDLR